MGVRKIVFGSKEEKKRFIQLQKTWGKKYNIYHNLPFLNVFTTKEDIFNNEYEPLILTDAEYDLLKKTSIDFTICDKNDNPLICLEFDGLQDGFNVGTTYQLRDGSSSLKGRRVLIELKLRVAHGSRFPYLVLGSEEFRGFSDALCLTIADGLIGEVMSMREVQEHVSAGFDPKDCGYSIEEFDPLSDTEKYEIIGNWIAQIEIESDFKHNPIVTEAARLSRELAVSGHSYYFSNDKGIDKEKWISLDCEVISALNGKAKANICLPDFKTPFCGATAHVAMEIAELLALDKLRKQVNQKRNNG
jgi:hypothetical protein